ncbi:hypothetical protein [Thiohalorhabdus methylotrophus]|uniref:Uncharacterized protein n=1 Tax=Thiohalorhabdus methylotrophus TaxID=3242694 RepID=A0ABV4TRJ3_9GAMM
MSEGARLLGDLDMGFRSLEDLDDGELQQAARTASGELAMDLIQTDLPERVIAAWEARQGSGSDADG